MRNPRSAVVAHSAVSKAGITGPAASDVDLGVAVLVGISGAYPERRR